MTEWKRLECPSCQEFILLYVWGKFQLVCHKCGHAIQVKTRLKKDMEEEDYGTGSEIS